MKKILSLIAMLVMTATAFAETTSEKLVEDNYALAGKVLSPKAITVDWATQKLVAVLDMTTCSDTENERVFSVSNNKTDVANWDQTNGGSTVHLFYTKDAQVWTGAGMETFHQKFAVQYRYQGDAGATSYYKEVTDPSTVTIVMDKTGISINGDLVFPAAEMPNLYGEGENQLYFGAGCGTPGYATYKSVELVTEKAEPFSPVTLSLLPTLLTLCTMAQQPTTTQRLLTSCSTRKASISSCGRLLRQAQPSLATILSRISPLLRTQRHTYSHSPLLTPRAHGLM